MTLRERALEIFNQPIVSIYDCDELASIHFKMSLEYYEKMFDLGNLEQQYNLVRAAKEVEYGKDEAQGKANSKAKQYAEEVFGEHRALVRECTGMKSIMDAIKLKCSIVQSRDKTEQATIIKGGNTDSKRVMKE